MYKNVLQNIDNIAIWPVISFVIFFLFFFCLLWWVFTRDRKLIDKMKVMPLEHDSPKNQTVVKSQSVSTVPKLHRRKARLSKLQRGQDIKKISLSIAILALAQSAMSQSPEGTPDRVWHDPLFPVYLTAAAVLLLLIVVALVGIYVIRVLNFLTRETARQNALHPTAKSEKEGSWLKRFIEKMNAAVPVEQESEIELEHSYDGIRELDNHLPPWWKWLFNGSIAFAVLYMIVYHVTDSFPLSQDEFRQEVALAEEQARRYQASQPQAVIDENALTYTADPALIEHGKSIFMSNNCGGCHRNDGGGNTIGPNLADEYWLHGGEVKSVFKTIKDGVVEKGMPAWGKSMSPQDVRDVTFFVLSLQGSNPPDAKAPQGEIFTPVKAAADSTLVRAGS